MISARLVRQRRVCMRRKALLAQDELSGLRDAQSVILSAVLKNDLAPALHQLAHEIPRERAALLGSVSSPRRDRCRHFHLVRHILFASAVRPPRPTKLALVQIKRLNGLRFEFGRLLWLRHRVLHLRIDETAHGEPRALRRLTVVE